VIALAAAHGARALPKTVDVLDWVRRSNASGPHKPILNFEQFSDESFLIRLFDGPTPPNRRDFHINTSAEFFYQIQGELTTVLFHDGAFVTEVCREGEMFWIPPLVPHLNQRAVGSIGLVIHGERKPGAMEGMVWYCEPCKRELHRVEYAFENNLRQLLAPHVARFMNDEALRTCPSCGNVLPRELGFS
jgi:3-hydroxyanthranilate 3,4-dioxygenase